MYILMLSTLAKQVFLKETKYLFLDKQGSCLGLTNSHIGLEITCSRHCLNSITQFNRMESPFQDVVIEMAVKF